MKIFDINSFNINTNCSIAASAGTGKTYSLVKIIAKLVENKVDINKILIVTYTDKAAGELKIKIGKELKRDLTNAHIGTIHSFCQDTLKELYFDMGLASSLELVDDSKLDDLYDTFIREKLYDGSILSSDAKEGYCNIRQIANKLYLDKKGNLVDDIVYYDKAKEFFYYLKQDLKSLINKAENEIDDFFKNFDYARIKDDEIKKEYHHFIDDYFQALGSSDPNEQKAIREVRAAISKTARLTSSTLDKTSLEYLKRAKNNVKFDKDIDGSLFKYLNLAQEFYLLCTKEKKEHGWISFNDMLSEVREAVINSLSFKEKLQAKYDYAIIDEFQDTNQIQWDIFKNVFLDSSKNHLIVVGDNKQSIYSFQGADVAVYNNACKEIASNGEEYLLPNNYRSSASMIDGYNEIFKAESFKSLAYRDVKAGSPSIKAKYKGNEIRGISIIANENDDISDYDFAKKTGELIIDYCTKDENGNTNLRIIDSNNQERNVSFNDFMIISRARKKFSDFIEIFNKIGIPFVIYKDNSLFSGVECAQWICLIDALLKPDFTGNNRKAFRKLLYTKFFGLTLEEASSSDFDRDDNDEMKLVIYWKELASDFKYNELIESILSDSRLNEVLGNITSVQRYNVFRQIGDYALSYLLAGNNLFSLKKRLLALEANDSLDELNVDIVAKGTDFDSVELMTIHASKGLDRPIVIVANASSKRRNSGGLKIIRQDKAYLTYLNAIKDLNGNIIGKDNSSDEIERLYYVAYTRAKNLMILPYSKDSMIAEFYKNNQDKYNALDAKLSFDDLNQSLKQIIGVNKAAALKEKEDQEAILKDISSKMKAHNIYKHSYASMSKAVLKSLVLDDSLNQNKEGIEIEEALFDIDTNCIPAALEYDDSNPKEIPNKFPRGAEIGTCLHEIFENFEFKDVANEKALRLVIDERLSANKIKLNDEQIKYISGIVGDTLNARLPLICGSKIEDNQFFYLKDIEGDCRKAEIEFNFSNLTNDSFSNYYNGFIDLIIKRGEYYSILDWKSDTINDKDLLSYNKLQNIKQRVDEHYAVQRVLYSYCLVKWLYGLGLESSLDEVFNKHFGGIYYVFIRGTRTDSFNGIYAQSWRSWTDLESAFKEMLANLKKEGAKNDK